MKKKNLAFSMIEILFVFVIASIIIVYELHVVNSKMNQYGALYYNTYNTLKKVAYNIFIDLYCPDKNWVVPQGTPDEYNCSLGPRKFPKDGPELCVRLAEYFNIPKDETNCSAENGSIDANASNIGENGTLRFKTSNATQFFIDDTLHTYTYQFDPNDPNKKIKLEYFIVYVDLNGTKKPNRIDAKAGDKIYPDIVPFVITRDGDVIPIGYPIYSNIYATAKVRYADEPMRADGTLREEVTERFSESSSINEAIHKAWGDEIDKDTVLSFSIPLTNKLPDENLATKFWKTDNALPISSNPDILGNDRNNSNDSDNIPYGCSYKDDSGNTKSTFNCKVEIDSSDTVRF